MGVGWPDGLVGEIQTRVSFHKAIFATIDLSYLRLILRLREREREICKRTYIVTYRDR